MVLLHVYTDRAEEGYDAEPAQKACCGRNGELPHGNLLFWQTGANRGISIRVWVGWDTGAGTYVEK